MQRILMRSVSVRKQLKYLVPQVQCVKHYAEAVFVAAKEPFVVELEAKRYSWCSCGRSKKQPFCDGSHKKTGLSPLRFKLEESEMKVLCGCKQTSTPPYCDGTHKSDLVQSSEIGQPCKTV
ncbi:CDGSH iron-sulfur domain-containing 3, mitochondrial [Paramuricea clavata]|uniref:CDGSH iron-sulfur domain-containing 3, mitochondrial n=1 Tax=Paramuricea clavata TaxID=317549 RepID=A0A7D9IV01_PARCT|nr:CDGSH iron-sulfur domain-containing 3, mitochondrial [Paramuricea clavata]